jgi:uncharacterized membrane protein YkvA (DUF1232 family)
VKVSSRPRRRSRSRESTRRRARRTLLDTIADFPRYLRLLGGLLRDARVAVLDKVLVAGAIAYVITPMDLLPDVIPFLGRVDDAFLLVLALQRLIGNAGQNVVADYWSGDLRELSPSNLRAVVMSAALFLPRPLQRRLRRAAK